jgi:8-oxo-dGTP pyrophosphatase MutT (NUDIX family)
MGQGRAGHRLQGAELTVRPRHAATLVAWRRGPRGIEVLMGRRAARHRFVPHHYVFPGGRLDAADYRATVVAPLRPEVAKQLCTHCTPARAQALAVAAVREMFEETGLALGEPGRYALDRLDYLLRAITPTSSPMRFHARFFSVEARHLSGSVRSNGELLDLDWRPLDECLKLPIVDVTEFLLRKLAAREDLKRVSLFSFRNGRALVR